MISKININPKTPYSSRHNKKFHEDNESLIILDLFDTLSGNLGVEEGGWGWNRVSKDIIPLSKALK